MKYFVYTVEYEQAIISHLIASDELKDSGGDPEDYFVPGYTSWHEQGYIIMELVNQSGLSEMTLSDHYKSE